jgi:monoterpene epsilon-lactone hydrolase
MIGGKLAFSASLAGALTCSSAIAHTGRHVLEHQVPVPSTVSPQLQAILGEAPPPGPTPGIPTTNAGWLALSPSPEQAHAEALKILSYFDLSLSEVMIGGVHCYKITPKKLSVGPKRLLVHTHGGGYVRGSGELSVIEAALVAGATGIETITIDYRMPPDHPFPAPLDDVMAVWKNVTGANSKAKIGLFGSSAGGGLVLLATQRAVRENLRIPDAIFAGTPWADLSGSGDSNFTTRYVDRMFDLGLNGENAKQFANGLDLKDPRVSPLYGSFDGFPATLLISGTRDFLLSDTVMVDRKLRDAGRPSELIIYEGQDHGAYFSGLNVPETHMALKDISAFLLGELK